MTEEPELCDDEGCVTRVDPGDRLPVRYLAGDPDNGRVLRIGFTRPVTDEDRADLREAVNLFRKVVCPADDDAVAFIRVIGEEFVRAGFPAGDRLVILANVRDALARLKLLGRKS